MKILHLMLACFYIDEYNYQENILPKQNKLDGHNVEIIASTETYINNLLPGYVNPGSYFNEDGIYVNRIPYRRIINQTISSKLRMYHNVYKHIESFSPDIIFCHGIMTYELKTIIKYKINNPNVKLIFDSHADFNNSANGIFSRYILHGIYYKRIIKRALPFINNILCVNYESILFLEKLYKIPSAILQLYPLGGEILEENIRLDKRNRIRKSLNIRDNDILIIHTGKMTKEKKTEDVIKAFYNIKKENLRLILIGSMSEDIELLTKKYLNNDKRISYLGWKNSNELADYLCAGDLYVQPGTQSSTMQNALCNNCAAALFPHESHKYLLGERVFYIENIRDMEYLFDEISVRQDILEEKRKMSYKFAKTTLDYKKLAEKIYDI
jgi:glycosyltransferase involved in cell wall biosynthesis